MSQSHPGFVTEKLQRIHVATGVSIEEIERDYWDFFNDPWMQDDEQFPTNEARHKYAAAVIWTRYISRPSVKEYDIILVGMSGDRITRTGKLTAELFALVRSEELNKGEKKPVTRLRRVVLQQELTSLRKGVLLNHKYNRVKLGEFSRGGDMIADNRTVFSDPIELKADPSRILAQVNPLRIERLADVEKYPSKVGSDGYMDRTDWRVIRGIIANMTISERDDGTEFGVYTIADDSIGDRSRTTSDGRVIRPGFSCWIAPELMQWGQDSECDFAGTVGKSRKTGRWSMNCYSVFPVHARMIERRE